MAADLARKLHAAAKASRPIESYSEPPGEGSTGPGRLGQLGGSCLLEDVGVVAVVVIDAGVRSQLSRIKTPSSGDSASNKSWDHGASTLHLIPLRLTSAGAP